MFFFTELKTILYSQYQKIRYGNESETVDSSDCQYTQNYDLNMNDIQIENIESNSEENTKKQITLFLDKIIEEAIAKIDQQ